MRCGHLTTPLEPTEGTEGTEGRGGVQAAAPLYLHYNFVAAVLNDVYGIQARGGCQCAGPYSQVLPQGEPMDGQRTTLYPVPCVHTLMIYKLCILI